MHEKLIVKIKRWYEKDKHQKIVDTIEALPEAERDYQLNSWYGVALNNTDQYQKALDLFDSIKKEGDNDGSWHYRRGYSLYMLDRDEEAAECFRRAIALGRDTPEVRDILTDCENDIMRRKRKEAMFVRRVQERILPGEVAEPFAGFNFSGFWEDSEYARDEYESGALSDELILSVEKELGYSLPYSYVWLMRQRNGGIPVKNLHIAEEVEVTGWPDNYVPINGLLGIGREKANSLCGELGNSYWIKESGYPAIGVVIATCPTAGFDVVFLDYRYCGPKGEPMVAHVSEASGFEITWLADDFESYIRGLVTEEDVLE